MVVAIGEGEGAGDRPVGKETIVDDIEGFGFVAEVVLAMRRRELFWVSGCIWVACTWDVCGTGVARLIRPGVKVIPNSG